MKQGTIHTVIPSRLGSTRVPMKGMRLLQGKTLVEHTLGAVLASRHLSQRVFINSDSELWGALAQQVGVEFYHRSEELATSQSMIDDYLYDFIVHQPSDYLAVITPTAPFVEARHLDAAWEQYAQSDATTLISGEAVQTHCLYQGTPLNFSTAGQLPRSQDLDPVVGLNFSIALYDCAHFRASYEANGYAVLAGQIDPFLLDGFATIDIDEEDDFRRAELAFGFRDGESTYVPEYSPHVRHLVEAQVDTRT